MSDEVVRLSMLGQVLRARWRLLVVLAVAGALVGAGASLVFSPGYQTSAKVLLQGTRDDNELLTEAQVATSSVVLDRTADALGWGVGGIDLEDSVEAAVVDGNVVQIKATAGTPERAQQLADHVAEEYVGYANQLASDTADASDQLRREQQEALRREVSETNRRITELHQAAGNALSLESVDVRTELEGLRSSLSEAMRTLDEEAAGASPSNTVVLGPAQRPVDPAPPTMTQFVAGGAIVFFLLGVFGHLVAARTDRRLRGEGDIGAALGASVLAGVEVPAPATDGGAAAPSGWRARARQFLLGSEPWHTPRPQVSGDDHGREIRYRRVLSRLRRDMTGRSPVLVVAADDDPAARRAAARLRVKAATEPSAPALRVAEYFPARPTVEDGDLAGVLVVLTAGTRTAWELVRLVEACADAGHGIVGVVVTYRALPADTPRADSGQPESSPVPADGDAMAGSP